MMNMFTLRVIWFIVLEFPMSWLQPFLKNSKWIVGKNQGNPKLRARWCQLAPNSLLVYTSHVISNAVSPAPKYQLSVWHLQPSQSEDRCHIWSLIILMIHDLEFPVEYYSISNMAASMFSKIRYLLQQYASTSHMLHKWYGRIAFIWWKLTTKTKFFSG